MIIEMIDREQKRQREIERVIEKKRKSQKEIKEKDRVRY